MQKFPLRSRFLSSENEDDLYYDAGLDIDAESLLQNYNRRVIVLSHLNNKSSVLCPESQNITSQYLALQQLDAHQKMVSRAKGCIDTTAPKSMQSYISAVNKKKKAMWHQSCSDLNGSMSDIAADECSTLDVPKAHSMRNPEVDNTSLSSSYKNKGIQTGSPFVTFGSGTADKITWYLEALSVGELQSQYFAYQERTGKALENQKHPSKAPKRIIKGDIMDWHKEHFIKPRKPFSPRLVADQASSSKVKDMRCYNPPFRKKKRHQSSHSSDTFESYDEEDEEEAGEQPANDEAEVESEIGDNNTSSNGSIQEIGPEDRKMSSTSSNVHVTKEKSLPHHSHVKRHSRTPLQLLSKNEEDKYLNFLSKVTEDILRSGVYTDRAIQRSFEFHLQFYQSESDREKLQLLIEQVMEGLQISNDETEDVITRRTHLPNMEAFMLGRPYTPPEKESSELLPSLNDSLRINEAETSLHYTVDQSFGIPSSRTISEIISTVTDVAGPSCLKADNS